MPTRTDCSSCGKKLKVRDELIGRKIKCPACGTIFVADEATAVTVGEPRLEPKKAALDQDVPTPAGKRATPPRAEEDSEDRLMRRRKKNKPVPAMNGVWIWVAVAAAVVLVVVIGGFVILFFTGSSKNEPVAKQGPPKADPITLPELSPRQLIQPGVHFQEVTLRRAAMPMRVWYYEPEETAGKLPLVVVPPAGSTLFAGMELADSDRPEHFPYVHAGFAVASFEIDGNVPKLEKTTLADRLKGAREFRDAEAGLANFRAMLDFLLAKVPTIDPSRIYIAGHSSAGTLALLVAAQEPRIKACAAYAAAPDVESRVAKFIPTLDRALTGYRDFLHFSSPTTHVDKLACPVFLFHAEDDKVVPLAQSTEFAALLKKTNPHVTLVTTPKGGHYTPMIREGIPRAITWFQGIEKQRR
jgi:dienelactone hydrolase